MKENEGKKENKMKDSKWRKEMSKRRKEKTKINKEKERKKTK